MATIKNPANLFDFIHIFFTDKETYEKLTPHEKARHFFMFNRFMSINYPLQANALQHLKINPAAAMDVWHDLLYGSYKRVPSWMYVKTKKEKVKKEKDFVKEEVINEYCKKYGYSKKQINEALKFFPEEMKKELKKFERLLNQ